MLLGRFPERHHELGQIRDEVPGVGDPFDVGAVEGHCPLAFGVELGLEPAQQPCGPPSSGLPPVGRGHLQKCPTGQRWELAGEPGGLFRGFAFDHDEVSGQGEVLEGVQQNRLAHPGQPGHDPTFVGVAELDAQKQGVEVLQRSLPTGHLGRTRPGVGREGVRDTVQVAKFKSLLRDLAGTC